MGITLIHKIILNYIYEESIRGRIENFKFKKILSYRYRMPKELLTSVMLEMIELKLIRYDGQRYIIINIHDRNI